MELLGSPGRTLVSIVLFMLAVIAVATAAYMAAGWSFADASYMVLLTVKADGKFFILQLNRQGGDSINSPDRTLKVNGGDGVVIVARAGEAARAMFEAPAEKIRAGRATF